MSFSHISTRSCYIDLPKDVAFIISELEANGFEAYIVGGCVRDSILARVAKDWDITTNAKPDEIKKVFKKTVDTGIEHGTVSVIISGVAYEVTTYRLDGVYTDARHPDKVEFTSLLSEDLKRRDFTINAMAYSHNAGLIDLFYGISDLENKIISCVGFALERFSEDALRMLRAIRFAAELGFEIDKDTLAAIKEKSKNLSFVSKERILVELNKILLSDNVDKIALVFEYLLAGYISKSFSKIDFNDDILKDMSLAKELSPKKHLRWAYFLKAYDSVFSTTLLRELKSDNNTINKTKFMLDYLLFDISYNKYQVKMLLSKLESELFDDLIELKKLVLKTQGIDDVQYLDKISSLKEEIIRDKEVYKISMLCITGKDILNLGFQASPKIGTILEDIVDLVMSDKLENNKEELLGYIKDKYKENE